MTALNGQQLAFLTRRLAGEIDPWLHISGVMSTDRGSGYAEVLVSLAGCHRKPCALLLNIDRSDAAAMERDLAHKLNRAITEHVSLP